MASSRQAGVKNNQQLPGSTAKVLRETIHTALQCNALFQASVRPKRIHSILISRYYCDRSSHEHKNAPLPSQQKRIASVKELE